MNDTKLLFMDVKNLDAHNWVSRDRMSEGIFDSLVAQIDEWHALSGIGGTDKVSSADDFMVAYREYVHTHYFHNDDEGLSGIDV